MARFRVVLAMGMLVTLSAPPVARADSHWWNLELEAGSEYDSNVFRLETPPDGSADLEAAPLARLGVHARWRYRHARQDVVDAQGFAGTKIFATQDAQSENVVVGSLAASYSRTIPSRDLVLSVRGTTYDADDLEVFGPGRSVAGRTFASHLAEGAATLQLRPGHRLGVSVGYRWFDFKPDHDFDWHGLSPSAGYQGLIWLGDPDTDPDVASLDVAVNYRLDVRDYHGLAYRNQCGSDEPLEPRCPVPTGIGRADLTHVLSAEVAYTGERIYSARYQVEINDSNSFTQSFVRHRVDLAVTSELFWDVFLTARGTLLFNEFLDSLLVARDINTQSFVSIDDENRNSLSLVLSRKLSRQLTLEGRYLFFTNEFATRELDFRRQTAYLGLVFTTGS